MLDPVLEMLLSKLLNLLLFISISHKWLKNIKLAHLVFSSLILVELSSEAVYHYHLNLYHKIHYIKTLFNISLESANFNALQEQPSIF